MKSVGVYCYILSFQKFAVYCYYTKTRTVDELKNRTEVGEKGTYPLPLQKTKPLSITLNNIKNSDHLNLLYAMRGEGFRALPHPKQII